MNTAYQHYDFPLVVTFWYLVVYRTLLIFKTVNRDPKLVFLKIVLSALVTSSFIEIRGPLKV